MATDLFTVLPERAAERSVRISFNGVEKRVVPGTTVAAALLGAGESRLRASPVSGDSRAPYCMMGVCFECLVEIDGVPNRQSCLIPVAEGMTIRSQEGRVQLDAKEAVSHE
ncbi:MAG: (2Fe-2S)-binding protein [Comamonadaceae bacterium]|nr:MAG: (2Fe-2S)-binding protein [Comamonadaceae bacterium]